MKLLNEFGKLRLHGEREHVGVSIIMASRVRGTEPSEADDIFLFQILIYFKNYQINFGNLDYNTFFFVGRGKVHSQIEWGPESSTGL